MTEKPARFERLLKLLVSLLLGLGGGALISANVSIEIDNSQRVTPEEQRNGWDPDLAREAAADASIADFTISGAGPALEDSSGAQVRLWDFSRAINGGEHFPCFHQEIGDCVANGAANAINYLQAVQLARGPPDDFNIFGAASGTKKFRPAHRPWIYGVSRTAPDLGDGKLGRSDGSVGRWAAEAVREYGVLPADGEGVPPYSGQLARQWGLSVPREFWPKAEDFKVRAVACVRSYEDVRDALSNGYPVTIASNVGFRMEPRTAGGKSWGIRSGHWNHQMCLIAVDDKAVSPFDGQRGSAYVMNSWGAAAHGQPADDAPPGGFWIDRTSIEDIVGQGDSWAYSNFDGFPARDLDTNIFQAVAAGAPLEIPDLCNFESEITELPACGLVGFDARSMNLLGGASLVLSALGIGVLAKRRATQLAA